jgi:hypothetical protein
MPLNANATSFGRDHGGGLALPSYLMPNYRNGALSSVLDETEEVAGGPGGGLDGRIIEDSGAGTGTGGTPHDTRGGGYGIPEGAGPSGGGSGGTTGGGPLGPPPELGGSGPPITPPGITLPETGGGTPDPGGGGGGGGGTGGGGAAGGGTGAIGLENLGALIERLMGNPNPMSSDHVMQIRGALAAERNRERMERAAAINTDSARRGVFHSTIPSFGLAALEGELAEREALADAQLTQQSAQFQQIGQQSSIDNAFRFLQMGRDGKMQQANIGAIMAELGMRGAPSMDGVMNAWMAQPGPQVGGMDPGIFALLGQLMQGGGGGGGGGGASGGFDISQLLQWLQQQGGGGTQLPAELGVPT